MLHIQAFFSAIRSRNWLLYSNGILSLLLAFVMGILTFFDDRLILGIDPWIKPMKFFLSICILSWTMAWILWYLESPKITRYYSILLVSTMLVEMIAVCLQSYRGTTSHFNVSSAFNGLVFSIMGFAILSFTIGTAIICFLYFRQRKFNLSDQMVWSIRLGLLMFLIFSIEGGVMISKMQHTVGLKDGNAGLPILNWSRFAGDLRVSHFFGMHALQIFPLVGYFLANNKKQVFLFCGIYFFWVSMLFIQAMKGIPFF